MALSVPRSALTPRFSPSQMTGFSRRTFDDIEKFIRDNEHSMQKVNFGIDLLVRGMVLVTKGIAQEKSGGPVAPGRRSVPALAYRIPVQRITGAYFAGWHIYRIRSGHWVITNDSLEAYLIENGIYQRVRRPVLKLSLIGMLNFMQTTRTAERFFDWVLAPRRNEKGQFVPFKQRLGTGVVGTGRQYASFYGGNRRGRGTFVTRDVMAGPRRRLPR